jgi:hypothetical protein
MAQNPVRMKLELPKPVNGFTFHLEPFSAPSSYGTSVATLTGRSESGCVFKEDIFLNSKDIIGLSQEQIFFKMQELIDIAALRVEAQANLESAVRSIE